jgi:hypothetical protein
MNKKTAIYCLVTLSLGMMLFCAGVLVGITMEGNLDKWSRNLDLSDWVSLCLIATLSLALWLSLMKKQA